MARPQKWTDEAERRQAQSERRKAERAQRRPERHFICIDGEGVTRGRDHYYVLLGVNDREGLVSESISDPGGLEFTEILEFLWGIYLRFPDAIFGGFYLGYDFTQWFKGLPEERAKYLFHPELRARRPVQSIDRETGEITIEDNPLGPFPVRWGEWEFDILGMKRFKLRKSGQKRWMFICDTGSFFQSSFLVAINPETWNNPVVSNEEYERIRVGKDNRDAAALDSDMCEYNALENRAHSRVLARLDSGMANAGIRLAKDEWFGPGQAAQKWLDRVRCPDRKMVRHKVPSHGPHGDILHKAGLTYYGGWFEIFAHGHVPGTTWEYDINSAYPHAIAGLPCILHGQWERDDSDPRESERDSIRFVHARVLGNDAFCGAMLHRRKDHSIVRPYETEGWYWEDELYAAIQAGIVSRVQVYSGLRYIQCGCPPPLGGIADLYRGRQMVGKNSAEGKVLKLIYNSGYGKIAQSKGNPKYANAIYASRITSGCRRMVLEAIGTHPKGTNALLMVATDAVYFRSQHGSLSLSDKMGDWEETRKENLTLFKPGVYWSDDTRQRIRDGKHPKFKSRGISATEFARQLGDIDALFREWDNGDSQDYPGITFTTKFAMVTPLQALQRGKWGLAGALGHEPNELCEGCNGAHLRQDSNPEQKRRGLYKDGDIWRSSPWDTGGETIESTPYDKAFGQPDPDEYGINDDGTVSESWRIAE